MSNTKTDIRCSGSMARRALPVFLLAVVVAVASAQSSGTADPFSIWDHADNPAAWGLFPDTVAAGFRGQALVDDLAAYDGTGLPGTVDALFGMPGVLYRFNALGAVGSHEVTTSMALGEFASLGFRNRWETPLPTVLDIGRQDMGLIVRPLPYLSIAAGMNDVFDYAGDGLGAISMGLAIRPLAFDKTMGSAFSLSADASYLADTFSLDTIGARFTLDSWMSFSASYALDTGSLGLTATVALSGSESSAGMAMPLASDASESMSIDVGQSVRLGRSMKSAARVFNGATLLVESPGIYAGTPPLMELDAGIIEMPIWSAQALAAIERAATDPTIRALVMIEPPLFESEARAQEFGRAIARFKKAGKPLYVFATTMDRLSYIYAASGADLVAMDPNGMLPIVDVATFSFYLKNVFDKLGIDLYNLQSHETKTAYNMYTESGMTDAERTMNQRFVNGLANQGYSFLDDTRASKLPGGAAAAIGNGPYLDPSLAVKAGLVDKLMYRDEFEAMVDDLTGQSALLDIKRYARETDRSWSQPLARNVAIVYLTGNIIVGDGLAGVSIGESATDLLASLRDDPTIAGVILRVDSGGGSAMTSDHIARQVKLLSEAGKPVVVSMASYAASGGYYVSAYADHIVAEAGTLTGSIGVTGLDFNVARLLDKLDIGAGSVSASPSGTFGNPFLPHDDDDAAELASSIDYIYGRFLDVVAEGRGMDRSRVDELGKGQIWLGSEAVSNGLVDSLGGLDDARLVMEKLLGSRARYLDYLPGGLDMGLLADLLGLKTGAVLDTAFDASRLMNDLSGMGDGLLYFAPEYFYRALR